MLRWQHTPHTSLLLAEGLAVGTLIHGRVGLVGTHLNSVQRAIICVLTVISTLGNSAFDALIGMAAHIPFLLFKTGAHYFGRPLRILLFKVSLQKSF